MNKPTLLPCPFCGELPEVDLRRGFIDYRRQPGNAVAIYCTHCPADMDFCYGDFPGQSPEELFEALAGYWNARKAP